MQILWESNIFNKLAQIWSQSYRGNIVLKKTKLVLHSLTARYFCFVMIKIKVMRFEGILD